MTPQEKELLEAFNIDPDGLMAEVGWSTFNRGLTYSNKGFVLSIDDVYDHMDGGMGVEGSVRNSRGQVYNTTISFTPEAHEVLVDSECSCPVGMDCKHGVALLFHFLKTANEQGAMHSAAGGMQAADSDSSQEDRAIDHWLGGIETLEAEAVVAAKPETVAENAPQQHLIYLLDVDKRMKEDQLRVRLIKARHLKKGGYGTASRVETYQVQSNYSGSYQNGVYSTLADSKLVNMLANTGAYSRGILSAEYHLSGDMGELILKGMLQSGRCFWETQESNQPLRLGRVLDLNVSWREDGEYLVTDMEVYDPADSLFRLEQWHYISSQRNECGLAVHQRLDPRQLNYLLTAPPVPRERALDVSEKLLELFPDADIPLPQKLEIHDVEISDVQPIVQLTLHADQVSGGRSIHLASLAFSYQDVVCRVETLTEFQQQETLKLLQHAGSARTRYQIHRDINAERDALTRLEVCGFSSLDPEHSPYGVLDMVIIAEHDLREAIEQWDQFIAVTVPQLEQDGWQVTLDDSFQLSIETIDDWQAELEESEGGAWFEMALGFELEGKRINLLPLLVDLLKDNPDTTLLREKLAQQEYQLFQLDSVQWVKLPTRRILRVLDTIIELYDTDALNASGNLEFSRHAGLHYGDLLNDAGLHWKGAEELKMLSERLQQFKGIEVAELPQGLEAELRPYQQAGYDWMQFMRSFQFNGVLADDMGLGKTVQALTCLLAEKEAGRAKLPSLVIAPTSLMSNWRREVERFAPDLSVLTLQGDGRKEKFALINDYDVVLTTYPLMVRDQDVYKDQEFHYLILDEAQAIKNARAKTTQQIYQLKAAHRLCLSGTPIENHLGELWSVFHFLMPGYLGTQERFNRLFRHPVERHGDGERGAQLRKRIQPFMLRRTKDLVAQELPEKTEIVRSVALTGKQRDLYETVRLAMDKRVRDEIKKKGLARSHIMILDALLKLRQVCCDPRLVKLSKAKNVKESAKLDLLMEMLPEMVEAGRKILVFSQFTTMLGLIEIALKEHHISYSKLTGQTRKREEAISYFQDGDASVFLISLKAGGTGLNLTAADTVIHYDPWWNPAVEQQATDRAYRIGQDKAVFVYKLLTEETVEEKILKLQAKKQALADAIYGGGKKQESAFEQTELMELLKPL